MSLANFMVAWKAKDCTPVEKLVLLYIAEHAGMGVWVPGVDRLAEFAGCSPLEVRNALSSLMERDLIDRMAGENSQRGYLIVGGDR